MNEKQTVIRPYNQATLNQIETWLSSRATDGWVLVQRTGWKFKFEKQSKKPTEYFFCPSFDTSRGFHGVSHIVFRKYAKRRSASKLNKTNDIVFEIDSAKIDSLFTAYKTARNRFCLRHYCFLFGFVFVLMIVSAIFASLINTKFLFVAIIPWILPLAYATLSLFTIYRTFKTHQNSND